MFEKEGLEGYRNRSGTDIDSDMSSLTLSVTPNSKCTAPISTQYLEGQGSRLEDKQLSVSPFQCSILYYNSSNPVCKAIITRVNKTFNTQRGKKSFTN